MNNITKEDRNIIILIIIFLLIISIYFIYELLNKNESDIEVSNYTLIGSTDRFKLYELNNNILNDFSINLNNINIVFNNGKLVINNIDIIEHVTLIKYISFYGDDLVMYCKNQVQGTDNIIIYNRNTREYKVLSEVDNMFIVDIESIDIFEAGINIKVSNIIDNNIYYKGNVINICDFKDDVDVYKDIVYYYDYASNNFYSTEVLSSNKLNEYKKDIC